MVLYCLFGFVCDLGVGDVDVVFGYELCCGWVDGVEGGEYVFVVDVLVVGVFCYCDVD